MRLLLVCMALGAVSNFATAGTDVKVQIRMTAPDALELTYELPPGCQRLPFQKDNEGYRKIRSTWKSVDACGAADGGALTRGGEACGQIRLGLKNGATLVLPCARAYAARAQFFKADIARVLARLGLD